MLSLNDDEEEPADEFDDGGTITVTLAKPVSSHPTIYGNYPLDDDTTTFAGGNASNLTTFEFNFDTPPDDDEAASVGKRQIQKYWETQAAFIIIVAIFPILLVIGTLGNMLTLLVLRRKAFSDKTAASWLFKCLAVMCTICLWVGLPRHWLRAAFGIDIRQWHFLICQLHRYCLYCAMDITNWIFVSISADRLVAVTLPFKAHSISTPKNAKRVFIGLCIFFAIFNSEVYFTYGRRYTTMVSNATSLEDNETFLNVTTVIVSECLERDIPAVVFYNRVLHPFISFALFVIGPFCFMLAASILVARSLAQRRKFINRTSTMKSSTSATTPAGNASSGQLAKDKTATSGNNRTAAIDIAHRSTTTLMFVASVEFLVTATPAFFLDIAEKPLKQSEMFSTQRGTAQFHLLYIAVRLLLFSNFALHFFLFCLSTHRFRREVIRILCCFSTRSGSVSLTIPSLRSNGREESSNQTPPLTRPSTSWSNAEAQASLLQNAAPADGILASLKVNSVTTSSTPPKQKLSPEKTHNPPSFSSQVGSEQEIEGEQSSGVVFVDYRYVDEGLATDSSTNVPPSN